MPAKRIWIVSKSNWTATLQYARPVGEIGWMTLSKYAGAANFPTGELIEVTLPPSDGVIRTGYVHVTSAEETKSVYIYQGLYECTYADFVCQQGDGDEVVDGVRYRLYAHYLLDGNLLDSSGNGRHAATGSPATYVDDAGTGRKVLDCRSLSVLGQPVITPVVMDNTWSHWRIRFKMLPTEVNAYYNNPIVKGPDYGDDGFKVEFYYNADTLRFYYDSVNIDGLYLEGAGLPSEIGRWYDIELRYTPEEIGMGIDGQFTTAAVVEGSAFDYRQQSAHALLIGAPLGDHARRFRGYMTDVRVYRGEAATDGEGYLIDSNNQYLIDSNNYYLIE